jgi:hypothetical protein
MILAAFLSHIALGTGLAVAGAIGLAIGIAAAIGAFRSAGSKTWRENAEAEEARADRLVKEKADLVLEKAASEAEWKARQAEANAAHAKEIADLIARITKLETDIAELRARPNVDDLASALKRVEDGIAELHGDFGGQTSLLTEIRDALLQERRRDTSMRTRKTDPTS